MLVNRSGEQRRGVGDFRTFEVNGWYCNGLHYDRYEKCFLSLAHLLHICWPRDIRLGHYMYDQEVILLYIGILYFNLH